VSLLLHPQTLAQPMQYCVLPGSQCLCDLVQDAEEASIGVKHERADTLQSITTDLRQWQYLWGLTVFMTEDSAISKEQLHSCVYEPVWLCVSSVQYS